MLYILTGEIQCGKTSLLKRLVAASAQPNKYFGVISPAIFERDATNIPVKTGIEAWLLPSFEKFQLASKADPLTNAGMGWKFDSSSIARVNAYLSDPDVMEASRGSCLLLDEIGPLELHNNAGFYAGCSLLEKPHLFSNAIVVVRPSLVEEFLSRFGSYWQNKIKVIEPSDSFVFEF